MQVLHDHRFVRLLQLNQWRQRSCTAHGWKACQSPPEWAGHLDIWCCQGSSDFFYYKTTTRSSLFKTRSLHLWTSHSSGSRLLSARPTQRFSAALSLTRTLYKKANFAAFLQTPHHFCYSCRAPLHSADKHSECVSCLGTKIDMSLSSLRSRLASFQGETPPLAPSRPPAFYLSGPWDLHLSLGSTFSLAY